MKIGTEWHDVKTKEHLTKDAVAKKFMELWNYGKNKKYCP